MKQDIKKLGYRDFIRLSQTYYDGDRETLWDYGWIGPKLVDQARNATRTNAELKNNFIAVNHFKEVVDRHRRALVGKTPSIKTTANSQDEELTAWYTDNDYFDGGRHAGINALKPISKCITWALLSGKGYLRLWRTEGGEIKVYCPHPLDIEVLTRYGEIVQITTQIFAGIEHSESPLSNRSAGKTTDIIYEIQTLIDGQTVIVSDVQEQQRTSITDEDGILDIEAATQLGLDIQVVDLNDTLTVFEVRLPCLFTDSARKIQDCLNYLYSCIPRNQTAAGFEQTIITNALPPGRFVESPNPLEPLSYEADAEGMAKGPSTTSFLQGLPLVDDNGEIKGYADPEVFTNGPVDTDQLRQDISFYKDALLETVGQGHLADAQNTRRNDAISGSSRIQQRADFVTNLLEDASSVNSLLSKALSTVSLLQGRSNTVEVACRVSVSELPADDRRAILESYAAGLLSLETAVAQLGYSDNAEVEIALIEAGLERLMGLTQPPPQNNPNDNNP